MIVYGVATIGCAGKQSSLMFSTTRTEKYINAGLGYLFGPILGSQCWRMTHRRTMKLIEAKDKQFHQHIVKNRVDPTAQSATNPVPDFYGTSGRVICG